MKNSFDVCVVGLGYIGLPNAALCASKGLKVAGYDLSKDRVRAVNELSLELTEPGLKELITEQVKLKNLVAVNKPKKAKIFIICVPTPVNFKNNHGIPNLDYVFDAAKNISQKITNNDLIIIESTCPVGTSEKIYSFIKKLRPDIHNFNLAYCPERILPGNALFELEHNNRIIGGIDKNSALQAERFYKLFVKGIIDITDANTAEMCKIVENSFRDVNLAFSNEVSILADKLNVNVGNLISLANRHPRVSILTPGVGVGGHCLPIDPWFLINSFKEDTNLMLTARQVNEGKTRWTIGKIEKKIDEFNRKNNRNPKVALLGITYKANSEDVRESPALEIASQLSAKYSQMYVVDPHVAEYRKLKFITYTDAINSCDIIFLLVAHDVFIDDERPKKIISIAD